MTWFNFGCLVISIFAAGATCGAAAERLSWWRRGHRDNNPEIRP